MGLKFKQTLAAALRLGFFGIGFLFPFGAIGYGAAA